MDGTEKEDKVSGFSGISPIDSLNASPKINRANPIQKNPFPSGLCFFIIDHNPS